MFCNTWGIYNKRAERRDNAGDEYKLMHAYMRTCVRSYIVPSGSCVRARRSQAALRAKFAKFKRPHIIVVFAQIMAGFSQVIAVVCLNKDA